MYNSAKDKDTCGSIREMAVVCNFKPKTIRDLVDGFQENYETGMRIAYGGKLVVTPPY